MSLGYVLKSFGEAFHFEFRISRVLMGALTKSPTTAGFCYHSRDGFQNRVAEVINTHNQSPQVLQEIKKLMQEMSKDVYLATRRGRGPDVTIEWPVCLNPESGVTVTWEKGKMKMQRARIDSDALNVHWHERFHAWCRYVNVRAGQEIATKGHNLARKRRVVMSSNLFERHRTIDGIKQYGVVRKMLVPDLISAGTLLKIYNESAYFGDRTYWFEELMARVEGVTDAALRYAKRAKSSPDGIPDMIRAMGLSRVSHPGIGDLAVEIYERGLTARSVYLRVLGVLVDAELRASATTSILPEYLYPLRPWPVRKVMPTARVNEPSPEPPPMPKTPRPAPAQAPAQAPQADWGPLFRAPPKARPPAPPAPVVQPAPAPSPAPSRKPFYGQGRLF